MNIGEKIRNKRLSLGLSLEQVGNYVGVGKSAVRKWEVGIVKSIKHDKMYKLAEILQEDVNYFLCHDDGDVISLCTEEKEIISTYRSLSKDDKDIITTLIFRLKQNGSTAILEEIDE